MSDMNLLEEIANLRNSIKQYKNSPKGIIANAQPYRPARGFSSRGKRGRPMIMNRTLIINNNTTTTGTQNPEFVSTVSTGARKLINRNIYEKELQTKNLTKEEKMEALQRARQKNLLKKMQTRISKNQVRLDLVDRCMISGHLYAISRFGAKLVPLSLLSEEEQAQQVENSLTEWNGNIYKRDKLGNLKMQGVKVFLKEQCRYFQKTGECSRQDTCRYFHNPAKVAICKNFMLRGSCLKEDCKFTHEVNEHNVPHCTFFLKGTCKNEECQFLHVKPEYNQLVCRPFAIGGYCLRGKTCPFIHDFQCPDYQISKTCPRGKNCKLAHRVDADTTDARIAINTLDPKVFQLPDLTNATSQGNIDPRIKREEIVEEEMYYDSDEEDADIDMNALDDDSVISEDGLNSNKDFISI